MKCYFKYNSILILFVLGIICLTDCSTSTAAPKKYKQVVGKNDRLLKDKAQVKAHKTFKRCEIKTGILHYVSKKPAPGQYEVNTVPSYAKLDLDQLHFYKTFKEETLFDTIKMDDIHYIAPAYKGSHCFNIIVGSIKDNKLSEGPLTICGKNKKHKRQWIHAITSFKHCKIDKSIDAKTLVEFNKVNELQKNGNALKNLYYNSTNVAYVKTAKGHTTDAAVKKTIGDISKTIFQGDLEHQKVMRVLNGQLISQKRIVRKALHKQFLIRKNLDSQVQHAGQTEEQLIKLAHQHKELKILNQLKKDIAKVKKQEIHECKQSYKQQIVSEKNKINKQGKVMMKMIMEQNKLTPYHKCHHNKLFNFSNKVYVNRVCKRYYGLWGLNDCNLKINFCRMCCEHHVGVKHAKDLYRCKRKCQRRVDGIKRSKKNPKKKKIRSKATSTKNKKNRGKKSAKKGPKAKN